jgi:carbon-monoxide dehydrogenase medium subunit
MALRTSKIRKAEFHSSGKEKAVMEYFEAKTVDEASRFLREHPEARVLAGGASLVVLLKNGLIRPSHLVNLKTIPGLNAIEQAEGCLRIGALNRHGDILSSPAIRKICPLLPEAASKIASPPIRNMGTIGGNLCHADPAADFPPSLIALGAKAKLVSDEGERTVPVEKLFVGYYETVLSPTEILAEISIPSLNRRSSGSYVTLDQVTNGVSIVGVAAVVGLADDGSCAFAGIGLGGVAPTPLKVERAKEILVGRKIRDADIECAAEEARTICNPTGNSFASAEYRREMVRVLTKRALRDALKRIGEGRTFSGE